MTNYRLYWAPDTAAMSPEALLECEGIDYEKVVISFDGREQFSDTYKAVNPLCRIPTLVTPGGEAITETAAILMYLCEAHDLDWMPGLGSPSRGQFLRFMFLIANNIHTPFRRLYRAYDFIDDESAYPNIRDKAVEQTKETFTAVYALAATSGGPFCLGGKRTIADLYLAAMITWFPKFETDLLPDLHGSHHPPGCRRAQLLMAGGTRFTDRRSPIL